MSMKNNVKLLDIGTRLVAAGIFGYTAFLKFTSAESAILGCLMMFGAICMHLTMSEINIKGDGGLMFASAIVVLFCCMSILVLHKTDLEAELN